MPDGLLASGTAGNNDLTHLGNGVAAIVEGEIITIQQLRKELEPILPRLQVEAKNKKDFAQRVDTLTYEILQTMIDRILIVNAGKEKGILIPDSYIDKEYDKALEQDFGDNRAQFLEYLKTQGLTPANTEKSSTIESWSMSCGKKTVNLSRKSALSKSRLSTSPTKRASTNPRPYICDKLFSPTQQAQTALLCKHGLPRSWTNSNKVLVLAIWLVNTVKMLSAAKEAIGAG